MKHSAERPNDISVTYHKTDFLQTSYNQQALIVCTLAKLPKTQNMGLAYCENKQIIPGRCHLNLNNLLLVLKQLRFTFLFIFFNALIFDWLAYWLTWYNDINLETGVDTSQWRPWWSQSKRVYRRPTYRRARTSLARVDSDRSDKCRGSRLDCRPSHVRSTSTTILRSTIRTDTLQTL